MMNKPLYWHSLLNCTRIIGRCEFDSHQGHQLKCIFWTIYQLYIINIYMKQTHCKYCNISFDGFKPTNISNHIRWCIDNPKHSKYVDNLNKTRSGITTNSKVLQAEATKQAHINGKYVEAQKKQKEYPPFKGKHHTVSSKLIMQQKALSSKHRRLRRKIQIYNGVLMDSTWEIELAKRLDDIGVEWNRPEPIPWIDNDGIIHNYFPDFYLPKYNIYIDPKNPLAYNVQKVKIDTLLRQYNNIIFLTDLKVIKEFNPCPCSLSDRRAKIL